MPTPIYMSINDTGVRDSATTGDNTIIDAEIGITMQSQGLFDETEDSFYFSTLTTDDDTGGLITGGYLRNDVDLDPSSSEYADVNFFFGNPDDVPLIGDQPSDATFDYDFIA